MSLRLFTQFRRFAGKGGCLVVQRNESGGAQYRLAQPAHAEQQEQNADRNLQRTERHAVEQRPQGDNNERQHEKPGDRAETGRPPAAHDGDSEHDGQGFDRSTSEARNTAVMADPAPHLRPRDQVTNMAWRPPDDHGAQGQALLARYGIRVGQLTHCTVCHR